MLADVCAVLEHSNPTMVASRLDDDERITLNISEGNRGNPHAIAINESGLWSLVLTSRKPQAKRFKKWVTSEVIPSIRKTGGYIAAKHDDTPEEIMARAVLVASDTLKRVEAERDRLRQVNAVLDSAASKKVNCHEKQRNRQSWVLLGMSGAHK